VSRSETPTGVPVLSRKFKRAYLAEKGPLVVVRGPFPAGLNRSLTANSVKEALERCVFEVRAKTTRDDQFALVPRSEVDPDLMRSADLSLMKCEL
jgi:hypothetical protein